MGDTYDAQTNAYEGKFNLIPMRTSGSSGGIGIGVKGNDATTPRVSVVLALGTLGQNLEILTKSAVDLTDKLAPLFTASLPPLHPPPETLGGPTTAAKCDLVLLVESHERQVIRIIDYLNTLRIALEL